MTAGADQLTAALGERYRIRRELGQGGMAVVYLADDLRHGRQVAIKVLRPEIARALGAERFLAEIRTTAGLSHPHILPLHDSGDAAGFLYYVMPFVDGESLRQRITREGALPLSDILRVSREVGDALGYAHQRQIIHRDVKPENILLADGHAYVADFGIARARRNAGDPRLTRTGTSIGTPAYMSPEQAFGDAGVDQRSDLYSLACVIYEMVTGTPPWTGATAEAVLVQRFTTSAPRIGSALDDALQRALARDADQRFGTVAEFLVALEGASGTTATVPAAPVRRMPAVRRTVGRERERAELRAAFDGAREGRGTIVCVAGEPGIGKTTLVEDFLAEVAALGGATIARGRCSERLAGTEAYLPHLEALEGILQSGGPTVARTMRELAPTWYAQVAVQTPDAVEIAALNREVQSASQERMKRELGAFIQAMTRAQPLVLFFDDLHWADASTIDLLSYLGARLATIGVLLVVTYRPSDMLLAGHPFLRIKPDLTARGVCIELLLGFLSGEEVAAYLDLEFPGHQFPPEFPALILARTEGSPLFLVDLLRYLRDRGVITAGGTDTPWRLAEALPDIERALPESVRGMIERKIAQLGDSDRALLVAASVQGYEFDSAVVAKALSRTPGEVEARLEELERIHAFVRLREERELPDRSLSLCYRFVHVLYQNELYASLRATRRVDLHTAVASALESAWKGRTGDVAQELAVLWEGARDPSRSAEYYLRASRHAFEVHANQEAATLAERGLARVADLPEARDRDRRELALQVAAGAALRLSRGYGTVEVGNAYRRANALSEKARDDSHIVEILRGLWEYHELRAEYSVAFDFAKQLFSFADTRKSPSLLLVAHDTLGDTNLWLGEFRAARRHFERGFALYDRERVESDADIYGYDSGMACLSFLSLALWYLGCPALARSRAEEAMALARELNRPAGISQTMFFTAWILQLRGDDEESMALAETLIALADEQAFPLYSAAGRLLKGRLLAGWGRGEEGVALMREGVAGHRASGTALGSTVWLGGWLVEGLLTSGGAEEASRLIDESLAFAERTGERFNQADLWRLRAEASLKQGDGESVEQAYRKAIDVAKSQNALSLELRAALGLARLKKGQGKNQEARTMLAEAYQRFTEGFDTVDLRQAKRMLDEPP